MLKHRGPRSLLIIDEFGKGTDSKDGIALLAAVCRFLLSQNEPPRTVIATHFNEIFTVHGLLPHDELRRYRAFHMEFVESQAAANTADHVVYLYRYVHPHLCFH